MSNPTQKHECVPEDAYAWSKGKAIYAGGVQFPPVHFEGWTFLPSQANNLYVFPAVGMAIYATKAQRVTDAMFIEAANAVAVLRYTGSVCSSACCTLRNRTSSRFHNSDGRANWPSSSSTQDWRESIAPKTWSPSFAGTCTGRSMPPN